MFRMGSAFAPDTASDWWNLAANVLIAAATLVAVFWSIRSTVRAEHRAAVAEDELAAVRAETEAGRERDRREQAARAVIAAIEAKATRQALSIIPKFHWSQRTSDDWGFSMIYGEVKNLSTSAVLDVHVVLARPFRVRENTPSAGTLVTVIDEVMPGQTFRVSPILVHVEPHYDETFGPSVAEYRAGPPPIFLRFTDQYGDRWELAYSGEVMLLSEKTFHPDDQSLRRL